MRATGAFIWSTIPACPAGKLPLEHLVRLFFYCHYQNYPRYQFSQLRNKRRVVYKKVVLSTNRTSTSTT